MSELPMHTYKAKEPYVGTVESVRSLVQPGAPGEVPCTRISRGILTLPVVRLQKRLSSRSRSRGL